MQLVIFATLAVLAAAAPQKYGTDEKDAPILKDERITENDGRYNFEVETGNGIIISQSGSPVAEGAIAKAGQFSYTSPEGIPVALKFVADENGFQPESDLLPVAPEFPHPIPQFVLDQIAFAAAEDAARARGEAPKYAK
ncbi:cuticle protein AMP1A [Procambarus clarkii]|uniref:cuticle protein AMP1A n=1 Tax=Procambarus clarkii TaxID=6728 RepID=UPI001E677638|nr:cuticle protein AMP1A-like [Procambarus clarkii]